MFLSTALFSEIVCPFLQRGLCKRPYCMYSHGEDPTHGKDTTHGVMTATDLGDVKITAASEASHTTEDNACLEELERINKEIEAVKSEVEKEQQRLSQYQSSQVLTQTKFTGVCSEKYLRTADSPAKDLNGNHLRRTKLVTSLTLDRKYVVDRARPKTDLEYDPCSNFSADLLSGSSVDCKLKSTEHGLKKNGMVKNVQSLSSHLVDSDEEGTLVIDIPASEKYQGKCRHRIKDKTTNSEPLKASGEKCAIDNAPFLNDQRNPRYVRQQKEKLASELTCSVEVQEKKGDSRKPMTTMQEEESSEEELVIDVSPLEDEQKLSNNCETITKELLDSPISNSPPVNVKETREGPTDTQVTTTEEPVAKPLAVLNMETCVLDDISTCLDNLRSESERIKSIQDVKMLPVCPVDEDISSQPATGLLHSAAFGTQQQVDHIPSCGQQSETGSNKKILQDQGSSNQQYFPVVSSQAFTSPLHEEKEPTHGTKSEDLFETSWPTSTKSESFVHKIPYFSGIDDRIVLSELSTSQLNPGTTVEYEQKMSTSDISFVPSEATVSSQASAVMEGANNEIIQIDSTSEEEITYSDLDLSESDPMEECYRIFMEANQTEAPVVQTEAPVVQTEAPVVHTQPPVVQTKASVIQTNAPVVLSDVLNELLQTPETLKSNQPAVLRRRMAHVAKFEANKSKGQIIIPLREGGSQIVIPNRVQACQKRAAVLTAAIKGCQSQVSSNPPKKLFINSSAVQSTIIPVGATLQLGTNLQFIVPEGNCALPLMLIPTTMPVQRLPQPSPPMQLLQTLHPPQPPNCIPAKSMGVKRKAKIRHDVGTKVPHDVRQRYVNLFVEEFLKTSVTVQDAFEKALAEEKSIYDRSINKLKYLSIAVNALKRLKNQSILPAKASCERDQCVSRGNVPLNTQALQGPDDWTLYKQLKEHVLSEEMLQVNNYPRKHPDKPDFAIQYGDLKKTISDSLKRICCRCGATFSVDRSGKHTRREECNYHYGKVIENRVPGGVETRYSCCESAVGSPGCQVFNLHVHDAVSLQGFVSSLPQSPVDKTCPGVYAVDTETCYTTQGLEIARVTVVNSSLRVVFDTFVKPDDDVIDYNTRFSGISKDDVKGTSSSLRDVQEVLLSFINADTFLVGHGLENDLAALKIIHSSVIDTSVVFPHRLGLPHKRELNSLTGDYLRRIIQESVEGHDTREDATACMELMLWRVKEDSKVKRW